MRTVAVWSVDVAIYYSLNGSQYGEKWEGKWSGVQVRFRCVPFQLLVPAHFGNGVQLVGFACIILGTFTYYSVVKYPCFNYDDPTHSPQPEQVAEHSQGLKSSLLARMHFHVHFPASHWLPWSRR
jgi:hypothetical protein